MTPNVPPRRGNGEAGLLTTELAVLTPFVLLIALVAVFAVGVVRQDSRAQAAADAAARAASFFVDDEADATAAAISAAESVCRGSVNGFDLDWTAPVIDTFTPGSVVVSLTCTESVSGFGPLRSDGSRSSSASAVATLEYWRPAP